MSRTVTRQKAGLVLAGLLSLGSVPSALFPTPDGQEGPPLGILVVGSLLGVIGVVAVVIAWRTSSRVGDPGRRRDIDHQRPDGVCRRSSSTSRPASSSWWVSASWSRSPPSC